MEAVHLAQMYGMRSRQKDKDLGETNTCSIKPAPFTANFNMSLIESAQYPSFYVVLIVQDELGVRNCSPACCIGLTAIASQDNS